MAIRGLWDLGAACGPSMILQACPAVPHPSQVCRLLEDCQEEFNLVNKSPLALGGWCTLAAELPLAAALLPPGAAPAPEGKQSVLARLGAAARHIRVPPLMRGSAASVN
jgi:hypothetical protein